MIKLPIQEFFYAIQGEGVHMGRAAFFVRLMGCDQKCIFCDAAGTWHRDFKPLNAKRLSAAQIAELALVSSHGGAFVVITGGEPTLYDLGPLSDALHDCGFNVHLETAGHHPIHGAFDWVTLSPKVGIAPLEQNLKRADEFKIIVENEDTLWRDLLLLEGRVRAGSTIWLHPEWSQTKNPAVLKLIVETVKKNPRLRAGWQLHKNYACDALDPNSACSVPLGGVAANGAST